MKATARRKAPARTLIFAIAACILTVILLGEIGQGPVRAAQHAVLLRA